MKARVDKRKWGKRPVRISLREIRVPGIGGADFIAFEADVINRYNQHFACSDVCRERGAAIAQVRAMWREKCGIPEADNA